MIGDRDRASRVDVLECTLRDGAYAVEFQFTADDTREIVRSLSAAGVTWIEVGHGLGLGAQPRFGAAAASDEQYAEAAVSVAGQARIGCFFIPGIGTRDQMRTARSLGVDFLRVGTNASELESGLADISTARGMGFHVSSNLMKSYVLGPREIARSARLATDAGANVVVLVDSAGGMLPNEVEVYVSAMRNAAPEAQIGFHGHNNLGLANGCSLAAVNAGAEVIDSTLQGIGRSAGNACTETMLLAYERSGLRTGIDPLAVMDIGERLIRPRLGMAGHSGVEMISGYAHFHSSFMSHVDEAAGTFGVDRRRLIVEVSKIDRIRPSRELFLEIAARLQVEQGGKVDESPAAAEEMVR